MFDDYDYEGERTIDTRKRLKIVAIIALTVWCVSLIIWGGITAYKGVALLDDYREGSEKYEEGQRMVTGGMFTVITVFCFGAVGDFFIVGFDELLDNASDTKLIARKILDTAKEMRASGEVEENTPKAQSANPREEQGGYW